MSEEKCPAEIFWWDGDYLGRCELTKGHAGPHYDGIYWFNANGEEVDEAKEKAPEESPEGLD